MEILIHGILYPLIGWAIGFATGVFVNRIKRKARAAQAASAVPAHMQAEARRRRDAIVPKDGE